jgi:two-component system sensor histidine kinase BaeS
MKFRNKLLLSLIVLIVFLGSAYYVITYLFTKQMLQDYAQNMGKANAEQWSTQLSYYYQQNGNSWDKVDEFVRYIASEKRVRFGFRENVTLIDNQGTVLTRLGPENTGDNQITIPIKINEKKVGTLNLSGPNLNGLNAMEKTVFRSMTMGTFIGMIITSIVALLVGVWLARLITKPLQSMILSMEKIKEGDLQARLEIKSKDEFGEVSDTFNLMTERLYRTEQARSHLVADVAHELRTPLTVIQGQLELIQQGIKPAEPATLLPIQDEVSRLIKLVQDLHQLSLAEVGRLPLERSFIDLESLLRNIVTMYDMEAEERGIQLHLEQGDESDPLPMVLIDPHRIIQVFVNLIANALSHTEAGGKVLVRLESLNGEVIVHVEDTGEGISEKQIPFLFDRFYRVDDDRSRERGGMGLGLAIAKEFIEAHDGRLLVQSKKGQGTIFTVVFLIPSK